MSTSPKKAREQAFALLFELSYHLEGTLEQLLEHHREQDNQPEPEAFAMRLADCAALHTAELDDEIESRLRGWKLSRLPRATLVILRLALSEILYFDDIPVGATINEAVELAKRYSDEEAPKFINGLLGAFVREREASPEE